MKKIEIKPREFVITLTENELYTLVQGLKFISYHSDSHLKDQIKNFEAALGYTVVEGDAY